MYIFKLIFFADVFSLAKLIMTTPITPFYGDFMRTISFEITVYSNNLDDVQQNLKFKLNVSTFLQYLICNRIFHLFISLLEENFY